MAVSVVPAAGVNLENNSNKTCLRGPSDGLNPLQWKLYEASDFVCLLIDVALAPRRGPGYCICSKGRLFV